MRASDHRKHIPVGVKLHACLLLLGFTDDQIPLLEWDHTIPLGLREIDAETGEMTPAPNDPHFIRPMLPDEHAVKTRGAGATTAGSDIGKMKKLRKLIAKQAEFNARILAKGGNPLRPDDKPNRTKRKRSWGYRPLRGGSSFKNRSKP